MQYSFYIMLVGHVTQLGVSRSKEIRLKICICFHMYNRICFELSTFYGQPEYVYMSLVFMFHSDPRQNFDSTSPLFSEVLPKICLGMEWSMKTKLMSHTRAVHKTWTIRNRYGYTYANICIFPMVSLSNGRHLTGLRDLRT